jgi:hypothetical protein
VLRSRMNGRFVVRIGAEEPADVVSHFDEVMNIHRVNFGIRRPQLLVRLPIEGKTLTGTSFNRDVPMQPGDVNKCQTSLSFTESQFGGEDACT